MKITGGVFFPSWHHKSHFRVRLRSCCSRDVCMKTNCNLDHLHQSWSFSSSTQNDTKAQPVAASQEMMDGKISGCKTGGVWTTLIYEKLNKGILTSTCKSSSVLSLTEAVLLPQNGTPFSNIILHMTPDEKNPSPLAPQAPVAVLQWQGIQTLTAVIHLHPLMVAQGPWFHRLLTDSSQVKQYFTVSGSAKGHL